MTVPVRSEDLSLQEMLRIMDAARTLRTERELVERELNRDEEIAALRERLQATTQLTGESATSEEIDAAIRIYFDDLHEFSEPPWSWRLPCAYLYIDRYWWTGILCLVALLGGLAWGLWLRPAAPFSNAEVYKRQSTALVREIEAVDRRIAAVATVPVPADTELSGLAQLVNPDELRRLLKVRQELLSQLEQAYELRIPSGAGQQSGIDRYYTDEQGTRVSGYYLILEARTATGQPVKVPIRDLETGRSALVDKWGERVPEAVYTQVLTDKQADGIVDRNLFAEKRRGELDLRILMTDPQGEPVPRVGQILSW